MKNIIVDGNNYIMIAMSVADRNGRPDSTRAILSSMIRKLMRIFGEFSNYYVCFDSRGGTQFRKDINPEYKATRVYDSEKINILEDSKSVFKENGFTDCTVQSCEADDSIFALCRVLSEIHHDDENYIVSRDKDMIQVVQAGYSEHLWDPSKKKDIEIPEYSIVEYKALTGDSSDNISGISGVGPKTAIKILNGIKKLTEEQKLIYDRNLELIDARRNPNYENNVRTIRSMLIG